MHSDKLKNKLTANWNVDFGLLLKMIVMFQKKIIGLTIFFHFSNDSFSTHWGILKVSIFDDSDN